MIESPLPFCFSHKQCDRDICSLCLITTLLWFQKQTNRDARKEEPFYFFNRAMQRGMSSLRANPALCTHERKPFTSYLSAG